MTSGRPARPSGDVWWRASLRRFVLAAAVVLAGAVVVLVSQGTVRVIGSGIAGGGLVLLMSLVFLEVGYSEDRARRRDAERP